MNIVIFLITTIILAETECVKTKINIPYNSEIKENMIEGKNIKEFIGKKTKRFIKKGECLTSSNTQTNYLINSGQKVRVYLNSNGIKISFEAIALTDANKGEEIKLFNKNSGKIITGYVKENGYIELKISGDI